MNLLPLRWVQRAFDRREKSERRRNGRQSLPCGAPSGSFAAARLARRKEGATRGQATTEVVLLMPLFMFFLFAFAKVFAMLLLVQKLEVASYYAARRWQLESHRNANYVGGDFSRLKPDIEGRVNSYLGLGAGGGAGFLGIDGPAQLTVTPTQVWQIVTLRVTVRPLQMALIHTRSYPLEVTKYVPNRDRPIAFVLPGLKQ